MQASNFVLNDYLKRIGFDGEPSATIDCVAEMMRRQLFTVPFENLDVQAGKIVSMEPEDIVNKIVYSGQGRGGYCYEVNGLFAMALTAMGIEYQFVAARPMFYPVKRPKTHMALVVTIEGEQYLCDLGFGSYGIRAPMNLANVGEPVKQDSDTYMLERAGDGFLLKALVGGHSEEGGEWANQYGFDLYQPEWIDFALANYLNSTHPDAIFVQKPLAILFTPEGRKVLLGDSLKHIANGKTSQTTVKADDYDKMLAKEFGLAGLVLAR